MALPLNLDKREDQANALAASQHDGNMDKIQAGVDTLSLKEDGLGNPGTTGYVLSSDTLGTRSWIAVVTSVNGATGAVTITKSTVGLGNVDNTSDLNKPISTATQSALDLKVDNLNNTIGSY